MTGYPKSGYPVIAFVITGIIAGDFFQCAAVFFENRLYKQAAKQCTYRRHKKYGEEVVYTKIDRFYYKKDYYRGSWQKCKAES